VRRIIDDVNVELLIVPECPNEEPTVELLRGMQASAQSAETATHG
jgi:hypothetical protein